MELKDRLKQARKHSKLTQVQLAEKLKGITTQQSLSQLETGEVTSSVFIVQIAVACGVNPIWLATGDGEMLDIFLYPPTEPQRKAHEIMQNIDLKNQYQGVRLLNTLTEQEDSNGKHHTQ